jgi:hypothetical protein
MGHDPDLINPDRVIFPEIQTSRNLRFHPFANYILTNTLNCGERCSLYILREASTDEKEFN